MSELEAMRAELERMRKANRKAFALLAHCLAAQQNGAVLLASLMANYDAAVKAGEDTDEFDDLMRATLLAVSSVALKQKPNDPDVREMYEGLRPGGRH